MAEFLCPTPPDREHLGTELDRGQLYARWVERQVPCRPSGQLQDVVSSPRADPFATAAEQEPLEEADLAVVAARFLVLDLSDPSRFAGDRSRHDWEAYAAGARGGHAAPRPRPATSARIFEKLSWLAGFPGTNHSRASTAWARSSRLPTETWARRSITPSASPPPSPSA